MQQQNDMKKEWTSYWDCVVVDARKPLFFSDGTILRKVNRVSKWSVFLFIRLQCSHLKKSVMLF